MFRKELPQGLRLGLLSRPEGQVLVLTLSTSAGLVSLAELVWTSTSTMPFSMCHFCIVVNFENEENVNVLALFPLTCFIINTGKAGIERHRDDMPTGEALSAALPLQCA